MPKTVNGYASSVAKREGKKSQTKIGDVRETLGCFADAVYDDFVNSPEPMTAQEIGMMILEAGQRRAAARRKS